MRIRENSDERIHILGLIRGSMLMYAVSLELILKARALFEEKDKILNGEISSFRDFMKQWQGKSKGHGYFKIVKNYDIKLSDEENELLKNFQNYTIWAGRFPFPIDENEIKNMEQNGRISGTVKTRHKTEIQKFLDKQIQEMKL